MAQRQARNPPVGMTDGGGVAAAGTVPAAAPGATPSGTPTGDNGEDTLFTKDEVRENNRRIAWLAQLETTLRILCEENESRPTIRETLLLHGESLGFWAINRQQQQPGQQS